MALPNREAMVCPVVRTTILLADDHHGVLDRVSRLLCDQFEVVAMVDDGIAALNSTIRLRPDVVVLDFSMPGMDGVHVAYELRNRGIKSAIVFLSMLYDPDYMEVAVQIGAGFVRKTRMESELVAAIMEELQKLSIKQ